jgi:hypothetical protein
VAALDNSRVQGNSAEMEDTYKGLNKQKVTYLSLKKGCVVREPRIDRMLGSAACENYLLIRRRVSQ